MSNLKGQGARHLLAPPADLALPNEGPALDASLNLKGGLIISILLIISHESMPILKFFCPYSTLHHYNYHL